MNIFSLVGNYLKAKPLHTALNILLFALGIAVITILLIFSNQLQEKIAANSRGVDLVVGAKGSPLQLILCSIFHIDFPTGNIKLHEAEKLTHHPLIKKAIPLALGDSYENFRIVGTNKDYPELYHAGIRNGSWWDADLEATIGFNVAEALRLKPGDTFASAHGLGSGGHIHEENQYKVVGTMQRSRSVLDNLILTNVGSVWRVHEEHEDEEGHDEAHHDLVEKIVNPSSLVPTAEAGDTTKEITSLLVQYRNPLAAIQLPRYINSQSNMQAASPAFETARLFSILGIGVEIIQGFAYVLIFISGLSIFIALYNSLKERRYDLAIMRSMGAGRTKLLVAVLLEGSTMTFIGSIAGIALGHVAVLLFVNVFSEATRLEIDPFVFYKAEWFVITGSLLLGMLCSALPAVQAYRVDIHKVLASN